MEEIVRLQEIAEKGGIKVEISPGVDAIVLDFACEGDRIIFVEAVFACNWDEFKHTFTCKDGDVVAFKMKGLGDRREFMFSSCHSWTCFPLLCRTGYFHKLAIGHMAQLGPLAPTGQANHRGLILHENIGSEELPKSRPWDDQSHGEPPNGPGDGLN